MLDNWVLATLFAVFMQLFRNGLQKHLTRDLRPLGVTWVRFVFGLPFGLIYFLALVHGLDKPVPEMNAAFLVYGVLAAVFQIMGTVFMVLLFSRRNFAVGITYTKTEVVQTALVGLVVLGDVVSAEGLVAILVSMVGVMFLSAIGGRFDARSLISGWATQEALLGIASGAGFAGSTVFIRGAALSLEQGDFLIRAAAVLLLVLTLQTVMIGGYFLARDRSQITDVIRHWKVSACVGLAGALGSMGWFTAMTLEQAAYVKALGQVEVIFSILISYLIFKERSKMHEFLGMALILSGILILLWRT